MSSLKIKVPRPKPPKSSDMVDASPAARKRRRVISEDEDEMDVEPQEPDAEVEGNAAPLDNREEPSQVEMDIDIERVDDTMETPLPTQARSPTPESFIVAEPAKRISKKKEPVASSERAPRKRLKKKAAVLSDEDKDMDDDFELEVEMRKQMEDKDADDDFMPASSLPPVKKAAGKKATGAGAGKRGRPKRGGSKGADLVITMKDERKITASASATPVTEAMVIPAATLSGPKKRRDTMDGVELASATDSAGESQKTVVSDPPASPEDVKSTPTKKKLPTIKKNKSLASTAPSSGTSTPGGPSSLAAKAMVNLAVRKTASATARTPTAPASELNLSDSTVYNMLFKTSGVGTHYVGVSLKDARRRELKRMRDQAREQRMTSLKKSTFDLLAGQEKVSKFETQMRSRNSPALYPAHLGTVFKILMQEKQKPA